VQPVDRAEFARTLTGLAAIKPNAKLTPEALDIWWNAMSDWSLDEFRSAATHLARSVEYMPNPYHFEQLRKAHQMTAGEAWAIAVDHARGAYRSIAAPAEVERTVRAMGGWQIIARSNTEALHFLERRFVQTFNDLDVATDQRAALPHFETWKKRLATDRVGSMLPSLVARIEPDGAA